MSKFVALNAKAHKHLKVDPRKVEAQGANERLIPVAMSEFKKLVVQYPIALTKREDSGEFLCVAVLGFADKENLFWVEDQWDGIYTPLNVIRQPFFVGQDKGESVICIDEEGTCLSDSHGDAIFDEDGGETEFLQDIKKMLSQLLEAEALTKEFVKALVDYDLLLPMQLDITFANGDTQAVRGLYTVDEQKLDALDAEKLVFLQQRRYLSAVYMLIASTGHMYSLIDRKNKKIAAV